MAQAAFLHHSLAIRYTTSFTRTILSMACLSGTKAPWLGEIHLGRRGLNQFTKIFCQDFALAIALDEWLKVQNADGIRFLWDQYNVCVINSQIKEVPTEKILNKMNDIILDLKPEFLKESSIVAI